MKRILLLEGIFIRRFYNKIYKSLLWWVICWGAEIAPWYRNGSHNDIYSNDVECNILFLHNISHWNEFYLLYEYKMRKSDGQRARTFKVWWTSSILTLSSVDDKLFKTNALSFNDSISVKGEKASYLREIMWMLQWNMITKPWLFSRVYSSSPCSLNYNFIIMWSF